MGARPRGGATGLRSALVVFLGGPTVVGRPLCWAPLGWGEPVLPWWGRRGFAGVPWWGGWAGPRVVNNVVINRNTVNATNITVYRNVHVTNAVVGVPRDQFGDGTAGPRASLRRSSPARPPARAARRQTGRGEHDARHRRGGEAANADQCPPRGGDAPAARPHARPPRQRASRDAGARPCAGTTDRLAATANGGAGDVTSRAGLAPPATPTGTPQRPGPPSNSGPEEKRSGVRERPTPPPGPAKPPPIQGSVPPSQRPAVPHGIVPQPQGPAPAQPQRAAPPPQRQSPVPGQQGVAPGQAQAPTPAPASPQGSAAPGQRQIPGPGQQGVPPAPPRQGAPAQAGQAGRDPQQMRHQPPPPPAADHQARGEARRPASRGKVVDRATASSADRRVERRPRRSNPSWGRVRRRRRGPSEDHHPWKIASGRSAETT